jgi:carboxypeptidase PM20D1
VLLDILKVVLAILALTTVFVVGRTLLFVWRQRAVPPVEPVPVEPTMVAEHLAAAVRCQTVPRDDKGTPDPKAFRQLHQMLAKTYPLVHRTLKREVIGDFSLLYTWPGTRPDLEPVMVMAHQDVVSAEPATLAQWTHPPFDGHISDGVVWGRGTLDIKNQLIGIFEGAEALLRQGYQPERTVLFGLGHDEETGGVNGCKLMGQALQERGIHLAGIVDEGGGIVEGLAAGVRGPVALIGVSEKGYLTTEFSATGQPGHSSTPPPQTAIGILARALARLEAHPMPTHLRRLRPLYHGIGRAAPLYIQVAFANVWLFGPLLKRWLVPIAEMNASIRTTTALTIITAASRQHRCAEAKAIVNFHCPGIDRPGPDHARKVTGTTG